MKKLQWEIYNLIREDDENKLSGTIFDSIIVLFIFLNVIFIILDTFDMPEGYYEVSRVAEGIALLVFTIEYILRLWTAPLIYPDKRPALARLRYAGTFMALIDLVCILPSYLPFIPAGLQALRLLRIFKITRYTDSLTMIAFVFRKQAKQLLSTVLIIFILMLLAAVLMYNVEKTAQPNKFTNAFSAFWWAISTVTTVGYGDLYPITVLGQILTGVIELLGIGLVAVPTGIISAGFIEATHLSESEGIQAVEEALEEMEHLHPGHATPPKNDGGLHPIMPAEPEPADKKKYCPYCGHKLDE